MCDLVKIYRRENLDPVVCSIEVPGPDLYVVRAMSDSLDFDGICLIRKSDVFSIETTFERSNFYRAALTVWKKGGERFAIAEKLTGCLDKDLAYLQERKTLVAIHIESTDPDVAYVGIIVAIGDQGILMRSTTAGGVVEDDLYRVSIDDVTKIEIDTRYLIAVAHGSKILAGEVR